MEVVFPEKKDYKLNDPFIYSSCVKKPLFRVFYRGSILSKHPYQYDEEEVFLISILIDDVIVIKNLEILRYYSCHQASIQIKRGFRADLETAKAIDALFIIENRVAIYHFNSLHRTTFEACFARGALFGE